MAARVRAKRREEDEVFVMEARLKLLKEQMATERKKREDALSKNGSGSVWLAGRAGPLRGVRVELAELGRRGGEGLLRGRSQGGKGAFLD